MSKDDKAAAAAAAAVEEEGNVVIDMMKRQWDGVSDKAKYLADKAQVEAARTVKSNPLTSLAVAAGVGFILGLWFKR